jgi:5-methyltetrahydropteroyltriglutamate--homocysteine methyltransferase
MTARANDSASCSTGQLALSPQCGFASAEEGNTLTEDEQWAKLSRCADVAQEVWRGV